MLRKSPARVAISSKHGTRTDNHIYALEILMLSLPLLCSPARFKRRVDLLGPLYCTLAFALFERTFPLCDKKALWGYDERCSHPLEPAGNSMRCGAGFPGGHVVARIERRPGHPLYRVPSHAFQAAP